jgi:hypothetical protein
VAYRPRDGTTTVLHAVVRDHLEEFLALASRHGDGTGLPPFVEQELRRFLGCGVLAHGFARVRCDGCGFDLHANVRVGPLDRRGREHLVQYVLRPALAQQRLARLSDGRVLLTLPRPWRDGTRALVFAPLTVLERLAALTPRPRINLLVYHGVLAPNAPWRAELVPDDAPSTDGGTHGEAQQQTPTRAAACRHVAWATLMRTSDQRSSTAPSQMAATSVPRWLPGELPRHMVPILPRVDRMGSHG